MKGYSYGHAGAIAKAGRLTRTVFVKGRYYIPKDTVLLPGPKECRKFKSRD